MHALTSAFITRKRRLDVHAVESFGLSPAAPDPVQKYWGKAGDSTSNSIMKWFGLSIIWSNGLALYALLSLGADAVGLQKFQALTWASCLVLYLKQVSDGDAVMTEGARAHAPIQSAVRTHLDLEGSRDLWATLPPPACAPLPKPRRCRRARAGPIIQAIMTALSVYAGFM